MKQNTVPLFIRYIKLQVSSVRLWPGSADLLVFVAAFGLYLKTLSPSLYTFDSAELATGAYTLGIVHNTGYPLYLLLAKALTLIIPIGDIAYRVNLFSALCAALSLVFVRRAALLVSRSTSASLLGTAMLGVSYPLWSEAVVAEVYTLHILFLGITLWSAISWRNGAGEKYFVILFLAQGLSFGNHMSTVLSLPAVVFLVWDTLKSGRVPVPRLNSWLLAGMIFLLGPLSYLYLPIRYAADPAFNFAKTVGIDLSTFQGVLAFIRGATLEHLFFGYTLLEVPEQVLNFFVLIWDTYLGIGLLLAGFGFKTLWERDRSLITTLSLIFGANAIFYINFRVFDKDTMFLPVFLVLTLWIAAGMDGMQERLSSGFAKHAFHWGTVGFILLLLVLNYPRVDLSHNWITRQFAEEIFQQVPQDALIVGGWFDLTPLVYVQIVEGQRPDVVLFDYGVYSLRRRSELGATGLSEDSTWRITQNEIRQVVTDHLAQGRPAFSLGENRILKSAFTLEEYSKWLYAITPSDTYDRLRPEE